MTVTVLSVLLVMVAVWVSGTKAYCDFNQVVPMKNLDINQFKGKWYVSHMDSVPSYLAENVRVTLDITPTTSSSATITLSGVKDSGRCYSLAGNFRVSSGVLTAESGFIDFMRYRVIATDYTSIALVSSEINFGGDMILVLSSGIQIWVRTANQTPDLTSLAPQLKTVCGEDSQDLSFWQNVTSDYNATCSKG